MKINTLLEATSVVIAQEKNIEQIEKKTPEWKAHKDTALQAILNAIMESKDK